MEGMRDFTVSVLQYFGPGQAMKLWAAALLVALAVAVEHPEDYPNLLAGSFTDGQRFSTGNTLPLVGRPWGFNHWAPQTTNGRSSWWFNGNDHQFRWIRCTHQPSPWIGDYGWFMLGPQMGGLTGDPMGFWEPRGAKLRPYLFDATTGPDGMRMELAPSMHGAILRVTFPPHTPNTEKRICFKLENDGWESLEKRGDGTAMIAGSSGRVNGHPSGFRHYIRAFSDEAVEKVEHAGRDCGCFTYARDSGAVTVRVATSFISQSQAATNFEQEVSKSAQPLGFPSLRNEARQVWADLLGRVEVKDGGSLVAEATAAMMAGSTSTSSSGESSVVDMGDDGLTEKHLVTFYTGLWRALTFPRRIDEIDANGKQVHYSPYARGGGVHPGPLVTDNGFWDTFRTVYPLMGLLYPDLLGDIIQGWLNAYKEGGWIPGWASPGYRESMVGTYGDVVVADAIIKQVPGFEVSTAWEAIRKDSYAEDPSGHDGVGKAGLRHYDEHQYIPSDVGVSEMVSRSLDFAFADVAVANAADSLASRATTPHAKARFEQDRDHLRSRGLAVQRNLFDQSTGLMRPKNRNGQFDHNFLPHRWGGAYTEGSAWHHSFPPYAIQELAKIHGGKANLLRKLHEMLETPGTFNVGGYGQEIHEMTEMRAVAMGQYGHNNQPAHHFLYLFALLGEHDTTARTVRRIMNHAYGPDFYAGDEDNGEMGSWFVLSALGLYSTAPGAASEYVLGTPLFKHVSIHLPPLPAAMELGRPSRPARTVDIVGLGTGESHYSVREMLWNGKPIDSPVLLDSVLQEGGTLRFVMANEPSPMLAFDPRATTSSIALPKMTLGSAAAAASSSSGSSSSGDSSASDVMAVEALLAAKESELEALKRSSTSLQGSLHEQLDTYSGAADRAQAEVAAVRAELEAERLSHTTDAASLQKAVQEQASEISALEGQISALTKQHHLAQQQQQQELSQPQQPSAAASSVAAASDVAATAAEVSSLKAALELEVKEHKRSALLLNMLEDHVKRSNALQEALLANPNDSASNGAAGAAGTPLQLERPVTSFATAKNAQGAYSSSSSWLYVSGIGFCVALCAWALATFGAQQARAFGRRSKHSTHIV